MRIKSIQYAGKSDVYNLEVDETHSFSVEGGIIVHNCADEARYFAMLNPIAPRRSTSKDPLPYDPLDLHKDKRNQPQHYNFLRM